MFDTHVHTRFSTDSQMKIEDAIKSAENKNISMIITEHMDLKFPEEGLFCFDVQDYFEKYFKYRKDNVLLGVELGMKEDCIEESRELVKNNPFDYIIGSVHLIDNLDIYYNKYYEGKSKQEAYEKYLRTLHRSVKAFDFIDSMGHIDYIARYAKYDDKEIYYKDYSEIIDEILKTLVGNDKCLELSTRRLDDKRAIQNIITIYKRFRELGGKNVTIGSDSHVPTAIGNNFSIAREIVQLCDLKAVHFRERKKEYEKI